MTRYLVFPTLLVFALGLGAGLSLRSVDASTRDKDRLRRCIKSFQWEAERANDWPHGCFPNKRAAVEAWVKSVRDEAGYQMSPEEIALIDDDGMAEAVCQPQQPSPAPPPGWCTPVGGEPMHVEKRGDMWCCVSADGKRWSQCGN